MTAPATGMLIFNPRGLGFVRVTRAHSRTQLGDGLSRSGGLWAWRPAFQAGTTVPSCALLPQMPAFFWLPQSWCSLGSGGSSHTAHQHPPGPRVPLTLSWAHSTLTYHPSCLPSSQRLCKFTAVLCPSQQCSAHWKLTSTVSTL